MLDLQLTWIKLVSYGGSFYYEMTLALFTSWTRQVKEPKQIVVSFMSGELYVFTDAFDTTHISAADLSRILSCRFLVHIHKDREQLFDAITCGRRVTERQLAIVVSAIREAYLCYKIDMALLFLCKDSRADPFNKQNCNNGLRKFLDRRIDNTLVQNWIERTHPPHP